MNKFEDEQLREATWARIMFVCKELEKIPGLDSFEGKFHYGTGEPDPNVDYNPCVFTVGKGEWKRK